MTSSSAPARRPHPTKLFVETTTRCNLGCAMCVKQSEGCALSEGDLSPELFAALAPAFPHLEALILNGVGEPLLHPNLEEFIQSARKLLPPKAWIGFQTNGLLLTNLRAISLVDAGVDRVCISLDGASPETFRQLREGGELFGVELALAALDAARKRCNRPEVRIGIEYVLMRENLDELPAALRWAADRGASFAIVTHLLPYDETHTASAAYDTCSRGALELFTGLQADAARQGLDLKGYFPARWKYARNSEEQRLVDLVEAMKGEAERRGVFIDMKKLLALESGKQAHLAAVFAAAAAVARETGLDLRLPEIVPGEERRCSFVEEGGAFVSWEGDVSPCYFLWHRYRCHASGWTQTVQPKVFGNLKERALLEIWRDPAYRAFRDNVLAYDYPDCSGCTLAPCDYVQTEEFGQDCHIREVPCGACLWCRGVFQCLS